MVSQIRSENEIDVTSASVTGGAFGALEWRLTLVHQGVVSSYQELWDWGTVCEVLGSLRVHRMLLEGRLRWRPMRIPQASGGPDGCESLEEWALVEILLLCMHTGTHPSR